METAADLRKAVMVSLDDLKKSEIPFDTLEEAFGPSSLGILIVRDLPARFTDLRHRVLSYASYLANLPSAQLDALANPSAHHLTGWSHGQEALKSGVYDTLKGSFYANCAFYQGQDFSQDPHPLAADFPESTAPNVWPDEDSLPGFQKALQELCTLIIDTAILVARACDRYAVAHVDDYTPGYLEHVVQTSVITKARLLHYFPIELESINACEESRAPPVDNVPKPDDTDHDSWCATHVDHGCLTGLTSAMYIDEAAHPPHVSTVKELTTSPGALPYLPNPPSPDTGLYIHARDSSVVKVSIPADCLGFQTGEALQLITGGKLKAVPHFVRAGRGGPKGTKIVRNTLAVFTQPGLEEVVDKIKGTTFGEFTREVMARFT